ncbi:hypothetical protein [Dyella choica]|uniref:Uncharacterized protein n=1 Tax=Dyella choica TaxID=1927959 RepID=A0A432M414_9GAMM|nr:hypothetical protein [Dyella choica]RUL73985.1 hypothetical protein EKH80_14185 [Dyella choica]
MPSNTCHPNAPHVKLQAPDWYISSLMMDRALDAVLRRVKKLDRKHDIPYLAGYSQDGKTIYIDRHLPKSFSFRGRIIEVDRFLILHEEVEKTLIDQLGLHYLHAHQIATRAEEAAVHAQRVTWKAYDRFMQKYVKKIGDERLSKVPADLDLKPYRDYHDYDLLHRMEQHLARDRSLASNRKAELKSYAAAFREELHTHAKAETVATRKKATVAKKAADRTA